MIQITLNGDAIQIDRPMSIDELLNTVEVPKNYLAVEVNEDVVPRENHASTIVQAGDQIEVVTLVGGG